MSNFPLQAVATPTEECKRLFDEDLNQQAITFCIQAAESGNPASQSILGEIYDEQKNFEKTVLWWSKSAKAGYQPARNLLALKYYYGGTVFAQEESWKQDYSKTLKIWLEDAKKDIATSQFMVGVMYQKGQGVDVDYTESWYWLKRALGNGYKLATDVLIEVSREITPEQKQAAEKRLQ